MSLIKKNSKLIIIFILGILIGILGQQKLKSNYEVKIKNDVKKYLYSIYEVEKKIIQNIPIYEDFSKKINENDLRTFLFKYHKKIAEKNGIGPVKDNQQIKDFVEKKQLENIDKDNVNYYFYGVPKEYRYLTPIAAKGLKEISEKLQQKLKEKNIPVHIKFAISSVLRPLEYQKKLRSSNKNAVVVSTHSYGVSFDIFWDDYFVVFDEIKELDTISQINLSIRKRFGFTLGDSLRRQFRSILTEVLLELQKEKKIYVILEKKQRCYHITPRVVSM